MIACNLTSITANTFNQLQDLQIINASNNWITYLDYASFVGLSQLIAIDLSNNLLTSIPQGIFDNVSQIEYINLRANKLNIIESKIFTKLQYLVILDLSDNGLSAINDYFVDTSYYEFRQFTDIDISGNYLSDIPVGLFRLQVNAQIDLSDNRLSFQSIRRVLQKMANAKTDHMLPTFAVISFLSSKIKSVKLHNNQFTHFDISTLDPELLVTFKIFLFFVRLNFGEFVFYCDCKMYAIYQELRLFRSGLFNGVAHDNIEVIDYNTNGFNCLHPAQLRGKPLIKVSTNALGCQEDRPTCPKYCRCWVRALNKAILVNCANQSLTRMPDSIPRGSIELDLKNNEVVDLEQEVPDYVQFLQLLDLSGNHIQQVNGNIFKKLYNISDLRLHNNELTTLPKMVSNCIAKLFPRLQVPLY